jgi:hypothetical protein
LKFGSHEVRDQSIATDVGSIGPQQMNQHSYRSKKFTDQETSTDIIIFAESPKKEIPSNRFEPLRSQKLVDLREPNPENKKDHDRSTSDLIVDQAPDLKLGQIIASSQTDDDSEAEIIIRTEAVIHSNIPPFEIGKFVASEPVPSIFGEPSSRNND